MYLPLELDEALRLRTAVAILVADDPNYIPVYERLEQIIDDLKSRNSLLARARRIVARQRDYAELI